MAKKSISHTATTRNPVDPAAVKHSAVTQLVRAMTYRLTRWGFGPFPTKIEKRLVKQMLAEYENHVPHFNRDEQALGITRTAVPKQEAEPRKYKRENVQLLEDFLLHNFPLHSVESQVLISTLYRILRGEEIVTNSGEVAR